MKNFNYSYRTNIKHQELVQILGTQNLYLRVVYAHIDNYTQAKGGWTGSQRDLAAQLELPVATINNQLSELLKRGLIVQQKNTYRSTREVSGSANEPVSEQKCSAELQAREQKCSADEQKRSADEPPITPIYNNKEKEKENYFVREKNAQQNSPSSPSLFDKFVELYSDLSGVSKVSEKEIGEARKLWDELADWKKEMLISWLQSPAGKASNSLTWTITDFKPKPKNYGGLLPYELDKAAAAHELWTVKVEADERAWICTIEDIRRFGLKAIKRFLPMN